jgi:hypothetical protein
VENKPHTGRHRLLDDRDTRGLVFKKKGRKSIVHTLSYESLS